MAAAADGACPQGPARPPAPRAAATYPSGPPLWRRPAWGAGPSNAETGPFHASTPPQPRELPPGAAYLGLGANLGDRAAALAGALAALAATPGLRVLRCSGLYETEPQGLTEQPWFLNCAAAVAWAGAPHDLLAACLAVEARFGRTRTVRWGPRTLDVDVLLIGDRVIDSPELIVPHPRLHERAFALAPLAEIAPRIVIPGHGAARELLRGLADQQVRRVAGAPV